jgi:hypothetical protein
MIGSRTLGGGVDIREAGDAAGVENVAGGFSLWAVAFWESGGWVRKAERRQGRLFFPFSFLLSSFSVFPPLSPFILIFSSIAPSSFSLSLSSLHYNPSFIQQHSFGSLF